MRQNEMWAENMAEKSCLSICKRSVLSAAGEGAAPNAKLWKRKKKPKQRKADWLAKMDPCLRLSTALYHQAYRVSCCTLNLLAHCQLFDTAATVNRRRLKTSPESPCFGQASFNSHGIILWFLPDTYTHTYRGLADTWAISFPLFLLWHCLFACPSWPRPMWLLKASRSYRGRTDKQRHRDWGWEVWKAGLRCSVG